MSGDPIDGSKQHIILADGQVAMFGYGSLLLQRSMELTLGKPYARPRVICALRGWCRSWDVIMPNQNFYEQHKDGEFVPRHIIYLNVRPQADTSVNGVLYIFEPEELDAFDKREWIYDRQAVTAALDGVVVEGGEAYVYVAKPEWLLKENPTRDFAGLRQSYLDIIEDGLGQLGLDFHAQYRASTDPIPVHLVFADRKREGTHALLADTRSH